MYEDEYMYQDEILYEDLDRTIETFYIHCIIYTAVSNSRGIRIRICYKTQIFIANTLHLYNNTQKYICHSPDGLTYIQIDYSLTLLSFK